MGIFEYILGISMEANFNSGVIGFYFKARKNCVAFFMLHVHGRGVTWLIFYVNSFDNLNAGTFRHFTMRRLDWFGLWVFMKRFIIGAGGVNFR